MQVLLQVLPVVFLFSLQSSWFALFPGNGGSPDFLLVYIIFKALNTTAVKGGMYGAVIGLVQDLLGGTVFGFHIITRAVVGYFTATIKDRVFRENILGFLTFVFFSSFFCKLTFAVLLLVVNGFQVTHLSYYFFGMFNYLLANLLVACLFWVIAKKAGQVYRYRRRQ